MARNSQLLKVQNGELKENDIVILVTGALCAGKSTFINALLDKAHMPVGTQMTGCTTDIDYEVIDPIPVNDPRLNDRRLVIVDTPGFDNARSSLNDTAILEKIVDWLERHCRNKITLGGIIYLHDISLCRYSSIAKYDLTVLRASFGKSEENFEKVVFVTSKWDRVTPEEGRGREVELRDIWKGLIQHGSEVRQFQKGDDATRNAWDIVNILLSQGADDTGFDIADRLEEFRAKLRTNNGDNVAKDLLFSVLQPLVGLFRRGNRRGRKVSKRGM